MTPIILVDKLVEFIKPVVANYELDSNIQDVRKSPQVMSGYLKEKKPKEKQEIPDFPYVIVRYLEDTDTENEGNTAKVKIFAGTYSEDEQDGWRDAMNVITRIKEALMKQRFIGAFKIEYPTKTELPEEQLYPEWVAILHLTVTMPHVIEEGGYLKDVF